MQLVPPYTILGRFAARLPVRRQQLGQRAAGADHHQQQRFDRHQHKVVAVREPAAKVDNFNQLRERAKVVQRLRELGVGVDVVQEEVERLLVRRLGQCRKAGICQLSTVQVAERIQLNVLNVQRFVGTLGGLRETETVVQLQRQQLTVKVVHAVPQQVVQQTQRFDRRLGALHSIGTFVHNLRCER